jgi:hypothetical protein
MYLVYDILRTGAEIPAGRDGNSGGGTEIPVHTTEIPATGAEIPGEGRKFRSTPRKFWPQGRKFQKGDGNSGSLPEIPALRAEILAHVKIT